MKKVLLAFAISLLSVSCAYSQKADLGLSGAVLRPYSTYTINCPSIIENVNTGDRDNLRFFYTDSKPFEYKKRNTNTLLIKTFNSANAYFEIFTADENSSSTNFSIKPENPKTTSYVGFCKITPL